MYHVSYTSHCFNDCIKKILSCNVKASGTFNIARKLSKLSLPTQVIYSIKYATRGWINIEVNYKTSATKIRPVIQG